MALTFGTGNRSIAFAPTSAFPLNANSYFESLELAQAAALSAKPAGDTSTKYYFGQEIVVVDLTSEVKTAQLFIITPAKDEEGNEVGQLSEVGSKIEVNENTFVIDENGVLNLYGYTDAKSGAQLTKGADGKLSWVVPSTDTVDGLQTTVAALQKELDELQQQINPTDEEGNPIEGGIADTVDELESAIGVEQITDDQGNVTQEATGIYKEIITVEKEIETVNNTITEIQTLVGVAGAEGQEATGIFAELEEIESEVSTKANAADVYTKNELDETIGAINGDIGEIETALGNVYTKSEVESYVQGEIGSAGHLKREIVETLPEAAEADVDMIYMIRKQANSQLVGDYYEEYMVINGSWEQIGNTYVDLAPYAKTEDVNAALDLKANVADTYTSEEVDGLLSTLEGKVNEKAAQSDLEGLQNIVNGMYTNDNIDEKLSAKLESDALAPYALTETVNQQIGDINEAIAGKADKATTLVGYGITDAYTKEEVEDLIGEPAVYQTDEGGDYVLDEHGNKIIVTPASGVYADTYTREEITELIADITGGESAADVLAALNSYKGSNDARITTIEEKLGTIAEGAQINILEGVKLEGEEIALEITDKTVTLPAATNDRLGLVKTSEQVNTDENGQLRVNSLNVNNLEQDSGDWIILNGGSAIL